MEPPLCLRSLLSRLPSITIGIEITTEREERVRSVGSWPVRAAWPPPGLATQVVTGHTGLTGHWLTMVCVAMDGGWRNKFSG